MLELDRVLLWPRFLSIDRVLVLLPLVPSNHDMPSDRKRPREPAGVDDDDEQEKLEFVVAGCGAGDTAVYNGAASSCFLLRRRRGAGAGNAPLLVVDLGFGARRAIAALCGGPFPADAPIYISHNHSDHAAELPVVVAVESKRRRSCDPPLVVLAEEGVAERLRTHRLHELRSTGARLDALVDVRGMAAGEGARHGDGPVHPLPPLNADLAARLFPPWQLGLTLVRSKHAERCYGFVLSCRRRGCPRPGSAGPREGGEEAGWTPLLGFSGDSALDPDLYRALARAPLVVVDARPLDAWARPSTEHAVVDHVVEAALYPGSCLSRARRVVIYGYGGARERRAAARDLARGRKRAARAEAAPLDESGREEWSSFSPPTVEIATPGLVLPVPWPGT